MRYNLITILCFLFFQQLFAQVKTSEVVQLFSKGGEVSWEISVDNSPKQTLLWQERPNSIKGIKTFVCYQNGEMIGVLSADSQGVSGNLKLSNKSYDITSQDNNVIFKQEATKEGKCGTCCGGGEHSHTARPAARLQGEGLNQENEIFKLHSVHSDGVLRVYRLALLITYKYFSDKFEQDVEEVRKFWASTEAFLNELYHRDVSVRFEIVNDERLIYKTRSADPFYYIRRARQIHDRGTTEINKLISEDDYDVGVVIHPQTENTYGLGTTGGVYEKKSKALCFAVASRSTIAHEIGHLFGSLHTFTTGGSQTYYSEPNRGMSVMGYNSRSTGDYFSLVSIAVIRKRLSSVGYYTDEERTQLIKGVEHIEGTTNVPYGVKPSNTAPIINTAKIKKEYTLPHSTFFQFYIPTKDAEQQKLYYYAHQVGGENFPNFDYGSAKFLALKPTQTGRVAFERSYYRRDLSLVQNSSPTDMGTYHFWLAVNDADLANDSHGVLYDQAYTKVNIVNGKSFKIKNGYKKKYTAGEKVTFTWDVDNNVFANDSKVRILMSDDFGETYKYTLLASAPNNGTAEVTIPHITLGRKPQFGTITSGLGIIKIEVIDHIAHDITNNDPNNGGFEIQASAIMFQNTPEPTIEVKEGQVPQKADVTAVSTCGSGSQSITPTYKEEKTDTLITRTWTASDNCSNTATFVQYIHVRKNTPLSFVGVLPESQTISYGQDVPQAATLTVSGGCQTPEVKFSQTELYGQCLRTITRIWTAVSQCSDPISHTQIINVIDNIPPAFIETLPDANLHVSDENQVPMQENILVIDKLSENKRNDGRPFNAEKFEERIKDEQGRLVKVIYRWRANDFCYNVVEHTQTITIGSNQQVAFTNFPANVNLSCGKAKPQAETKLPISGCEGTTEISVTHTDTETGDCKTGKTIERTYTGEACGQTISQKQTITIVPAPKISFINFPTDVNLSCGEAKPQAETKLPISGCGGTTEIAVTHTDTETGNCKDGKTVVRTYTASGCRQTISQKQTITIAGDNEAPTFSGTLPQDVSITENQAIPTQEELTATDNCSQRVQIAKSQEERQENGNKIVIYRWTATDDCGNEKRHSQTITIVPAPKISFINFPTDVNLSCGEDKPQAETKLPISGCEGTTEIWVTHTDTETGDCKTGKTIVRTYTATVCGQTISKKQTITIAGDSEAPTFSGTLPQDISVVEGQKIPTQEELTATDNCSQSVQVTKSQEERQENGNKIIIYRWTATDVCGNETKHSQTITITPAPKVTFINFPADVNLSCGKDKPQVESKLQISNCDGTTEISVTHTDTETGDCKTGKTIVRTYTATVCGQTISQKQTITIAGDNEVPVFSGELPKDISINENQEVPTQETLSATDNCSEKVQVIKSQEEREENGNKVIIYKWEASDECGNKTIHTQKVTIKKTSQPTPPNGGSEVEKEIIVYNGVSTESGSENYLKFEPIENYKNLQIEIFNELGQKVYESKNYQKNGEVFRGYANVKGVFRKGKRLPTGTYFYVFKYQTITGESNTKQGYLYVR
ncbi:reprolysin-like metallopeptidase [Capnocytophaga canis]|uniref:reprolysin-like metallopeptidase n=1 Tax=Capnocytophaga canis TaxID=1848903 RepID=UPI001561FA3A|nr:gliding motility-associated C-terminal domain-containing protein [Capnocytophaga canis]